MRITVSPATKANQFQPFTAAMPKASSKALVAPISKGRSNGKRRIGRRVSRTPKPEAKNPKIVPKADTAMHANKPVEISNHKSSTSDPYNKIMPTPKKTSRTNNCIAIAHALPKNTPEGSTPERFKPTNAPSSRSIVIDLAIAMSAQSKTEIQKSPDAKFLKERRKYVVVIIFGAAALLTPPDPITQIGLAIPLLLLYELSILSVNIIETKNLKRKREEENA
mgnify:CR=1 FL=1